MRSNDKVIQTMHLKRYIDGMGLDKTEKGITKPVEVTERHSNVDLGYDEEPMPELATENLSCPILSKERPLGG